MSETTPVEPKPPRRRRHLQFGLGTMLLAVLPISILLAAWAGMMGRGAENLPFPRAFFILMAAAAPMAATVLFSVGRSALRAVGRLRRRR
jgi:hypothetical protein